MAPQGASRGKDGGRGDVRVGMVMGERIRVWMDVGGRVSTNTVRHGRPGSESGEVERFSWPLSFVVNVSFVHEAWQDAV